jgi:hypothetical protein
LPSIPQTNRAAKGVPQQKISKNTFRSKLRYLKIFAHDFSQKRTQRLDSNGFSTFSYSNKKDAEIQKHVSEDESIFRHDGQ